MSNVRSVIISPLAKRPNGISFCADSTFNEWGKHIEGRTPKFYTGMFTGYAKGTRSPFVSIATVGGKPVGMAAIRDFELSLPKSRFKPWLCLVFVDSAHRGKGIGSKLVTSTEQHASRAGIKQLSLVTPDQEDFYRRLGWRTSQMIDNGYSGHGDDKAFMMQKNI